jgi:hypothetical protein
VGGLAECLRQMRGEGITSVVDCCGGSSNEGRKEEGHFDELHGDCGL